MQPACGNERATVGVAGADERRARLGLDGLEQTRLAIHELCADTRRRELERDECPAAVTCLKDGCVSSRW